MQAEMTPEVEGLLRQGAWAVWSVSGGKDSSAAMASTIRLLDEMGHPRDRRLALHADLGRSEWRSTHAHAQLVCDRLGVPLEVVRHRTHDMISRWCRRGDLGIVRYRNFDTIALFGPWSGSGLLFCRSELKAKILDDRKAMLDGPVVSIVGLRRQESVKRRSTKTSAIDRTLSDRLGMQAVTWNAIAGWTTDEVFAYHDENDIPLHEAYGLGSTRLSCAFCVLGSLNDLFVSSQAEQNQELYRLQVEMEARYAFSFQPSRWLGDVAPDLLDQRLTDALGRAKEKAFLRRSIETDIPETMKFRKNEIPLLPDMKTAARMAEVRRQVSELHGIDAGHLDARKVIDKMIVVIAKAETARDRKTKRKTGKASDAGYMFA